MSAPILVAERRELDALAEAINTHLKRIEATPSINEWTNSSGSARRRCFNAQSYRRGRSIMIRYISYQMTAAVPAADAQRYLAALDAGYVGRHHEHTLAAFDAGSPTAPTAPVPEQ
jgi:hypothetical protein